jgi:hypothetical protein
MEEHLRGDDERAAAALRDHVSFRSAGAEPIDPLEAAADLVRHVRSGNKDRSPPIRIRAHTSYSGAVTVRVSRYSQRFHTITISSTADGALLARHNVSLGRDLSLMLHDWLTASDRFTDISWLAPDPAQRASRPRPRPRR